MISSISSLSCFSFRYTLSMSPEHIPLISKIPKKAMIKMFVFSWKVSFCVDTISSVAMETKNKKIAHRPTQLLILVIPRFTIIDAVAFQNLRNTSGIATVHFRQGVAFLRCGYKKVMIPLPWQQIIKN